MKTKVNITTLFIILMLTFSDIAFWNMVSNQTVLLSDTGLYQSTQLSLVIAGNNNLWQIQKQNKLKENSCFSENTCLQERNQIKNQIKLTQRKMSEEENQLQTHLRTNLENTEINSINKNLRNFIDDLNILDDYFKKTIRNWDNLLPIWERITTLYNKYLEVLLPYVDSTKIDSFKLALQSIITNRINIRQMTENKRILSEQDEAKIERFIQWVPPSRRLEYLVRVISRVEKLIHNVGNSNMNPVRKERYLALMDEILLIAQVKVKDILSEWINDTPPVIVNISMLWITSNSGTLRTIVNESWTWYYVVLASGSTMPSANQVKAWQNALWENVTIKWSWAIVSWTNEFNITWLTSNTNYVIYFTAEDIDNNLQQTIQWVTFSTLELADTVPPEITVLSVTGTTSTGTTLLATVNESWTWYYIVLASGSTMPSASQVKAWEYWTWQIAPIHWSWATIIWNNQFVIEWLLPDVEYIIYFTSEDNTNNLQPNVQNIEVKTLSTE